MRSYSKSQRLLLATLVQLEASGTVEPGLSRAVKVAARQLRRSETRVQRERALGKLDATLNRIARTFLRSDLVDRQ